jgi:hypothetical protein
MGYNPTVSTISNICSARTISKRRRTAGAGFTSRRTPFRPRVHLRKAINALKPEQSMKVVPDKSISMEVCPFRAALVSFLNLSPWHAWKAAARERINHGANLPWCHCSRGDPLAHPLSRMVEADLQIAVTLIETGFDVVPGGLGGVLRRVKVRVRTWVDHWKRDPAPIIASSNSRARRRFAVKLSSQKKMKWSRVL